MSQLCYLGGCLICLLCALLQVKRTYSQGTYRAGAMRQISLVGAVDEEVGDYFPEFLGMLAESPFLEVSVGLTLHKYPTLSWVRVSAF